jgi:hypothetical protein
MAMRRRRAHIRHAAVLALVAILALVLAASGQAAGSLRYVALGDSYSAASGVLPIDLSAPQCLRSTRNYPHVIAGATGGQLKDVTCGAAETGDFFESQYPGTAPQLEAVKQDTQLVTMTIGGNDSGVFINAILSCGTAGLSTLGQGSPCKDRYGSSFEDTINTTTYPALVKALGAVRAAAPGRRSRSSATPGSCRRAAAASPRCRLPKATFPT